MPKTKRRSPGTRPRTPSSPPTTQWWLVLLWLRQDPRHRLVRKQCGSRLDLKSLLKSNPNLTVPKEVSSVLDESMTTQAKQELYVQQRTLNAKRKAAQRLERLQNALTRQKLQMQSYQEHMKQQLKMEMDRFRTEQKDLEQKVEEAKLALQKIENGELDTVMEEAPMETTDASLADMLGVTPDSDALIQQAMKEKDDAFAMVHQLQQQIHMIMQHGAAGSTDQLQAVLQQMQGTSPKRSSPQAPVVGPFKRHKGEQPPDATADVQLDGMG